MELGMVATEVELRSSCWAQTKMVSILIASCEGKGCRQEEGEEMPSSSLTAREIRRGATFQLRRRQLGKGRAANLRKAAFLVSLIFHPQCIDLLCSLPIFSAFVQIGYGAKICLRKTQTLTLIYSLFLLIHAIKQPLLDRSHLCSPS